MLERVSYFWGLFDNPDSAAVDRAGKRASFDAPAVPQEVGESFDAERIAELEGEFGLPGVGEPTEVDHLEYVVEGRRHTIRVLNRGISLFQAETPELLRLHRFFCVLQRQGE
jgi:hypothetical protein